MYLRKKMKKNSNKCLKFNNNEAKKTKKQQNYESKQRFLTKKYTYIHKYV